VVDTNEWEAADGGGGGDHDGASRRSLLRTKKEHDAQECGRTSSVGDQFVDKVGGCGCLGGTGAKVQCVLFSRNTLIDLNLKKVALHGLE